MQSIATSQVYDAAKTSQRLRVMKQEKNRLHEKALQESSKAAAKFTVSKTVAELV